MPKETVATDSWRPLKRVGAPQARYSPSALWTGTEMVVLGGEGGSGGGRNVQAPRHRRSVQP